MANQSNTISNQAKFGRAYTLAVQKNNSQFPIIIELPFTVEFEVTRHSFSDANYARFRIYNLSQQNISSILKNFENLSQQKSVVFQAGYESQTNIPILFTGNASGVSTVREGVNYITTIDAYDAGLVYNFQGLSKSIGKGQTKRQVLTQIVSSLSGLGLGLGAIGSGYDVPASRGAALPNNPKDAFDDLTGGSWFIDQGKFNAITKQTGEVVATPSVPVINLNSGLLGTPYREQSKLIFTTLFEPGLIVGQQILLQSNTNFNYNSTYSIISLSHRGLISGAICGDATTTIEVFATQATTIPVPVNQ